jgi:NADH-quinone oxidoreductase subunit J
VDITFESIIFLIFSLITLGGALLVVTTRNLFHAALYLMLSLFGVAGLFALLAAPFLAGVQVVIYIGAIAILIIFAIMLTPQVTRVADMRSTQWAAGLVVAVIFFLTLISVVTPLADEIGVDHWNAQFTEDHPAPVPGSSVTDLGEALVDKNHYVLPFEVASILLMAVLVGAVILVAPESALKQDSAEQPPAETGD